MTNDLGRKALWAYVEWDNDFEVLEWPSCAESFFECGKDQISAEKKDLLDKLRQFVKSNSSTGEICISDERKIICELHHIRLKLSGSVTVFHDAARDRKFENALKDTELLYKITVDNLIDGILVLDRQFKITFYNEPFIRLCGKLNADPEKLKAGCQFDKLMPFLSEKLMEECSEVFKTGKPLNSEDNIFVDDGIITLEGNKIPISGVYGNVEKIIIVFRDITGRRKAENLVKASEANLNAIFENSSSLIASLDSSLHYMKFNRAYSEAYKELYGFYPEIGRYLYEKMNPENKKAIEPIVKRVLKGERFMEELPLRKMNSEVLFFECWFNPVIQEDEIRGFAMIANDITARKKMEKEAEMRRLQLIQADKMVSLGILVSGVAHEINNPNNSIVMNVPLLQRAWSTLGPIVDSYYREHGDFSVAGLPYSEMKELIPSLMEGIKGGADRIKNIVSGLKDYARQDHGSKLENVYINNVLKDALLILSNMIERSTTCFSVNYGNDIPPILASAQKIEQVIINLVQNACAALQTRDRALEITTGYEIENKTVSIKVRDEGEGISDENLRYIKDPFFTTKRDNGGTGLGLSISSGIVEDFCGKLIIGSEPGKGTEVIVRFPAYFGDDKNPE